MPEAPKSKDKVRLFVERVAAHQGWSLNQDPEFLNDLVEGLTATYARYGYFLCPCRDTGGSREADRDIICPCKYAAPDIEEYGHCYCALFVSQAFAKSGKAPEPIPERRPD